MELYENQEGVPQKLVEWLGVHQALKQPALK